MSKAQYLSALFTALSRMNANEREAVISYYAEMIDDRTEAGESEEAVVASLESVDTVSARLLSETKHTGQEHTAEREKTYEATDIHIDRPDAGIHSLHIRADCLSVEVTPCDDNHIHLRYTESDADKFELTEKDGSMILVHTKSSILDDAFSFLSRFLSHLNTGVETQRISAQIPRDFAGLVEIETRNARITLSDFSCWGTLTAHTSNARIQVNAVEAKALDLHTGNARIQLEDVRAAESLIAVTSNGRISAMRDTAGKLLSLTSTNSGIEAMECAAQSLLCQSSNGSIKVRDIDSSDITLRTGNASISGTVKGRMDNYAIESRTSNARNNLPAYKEQGEKHLSVRTSNASIQIEFTE